jgi:lysozyme family protein
MISNFDLGFEFVIGIEGGESNDSVDAGGLTKFGISQTAYPKLDIRSLSMGDAKTIYRADYWNAVGCDSLQSPLDIITFDSAVNCGCGRAAKWLQEAYNELNPESCIPIDGDCGPQTVVRVSLAPTDAIFWLLISYRISFYTNLCRDKPSQRRFQDGWMFRVAKLLSFVAKTPQLRKASTDTEARNA